MKTHEILKIYFEPTIKMNMISKRMLSKLIKNKISKVNMYW